MTIDRLNDNLLRIKYLERIISSKLNKLLYFSPFPQNE